MIKPNQKNLRPGTIVEIINNRSSCGSIRSGCRCEILPGPPSYVRIGFITKEYWFKPLFDRTELKKKDYRHAFISDGYEFKVVDRMKELRDA